MIVGLVLAGGRSSRFGREKALAELDGRPFIAYVVSALTAGCERVAINARRGSLAARFAEAHALPCRADAPEDPDGPMAGVKAGLVWAIEEGADMLATAPCDTPFLPSDMVERLAGASGGGSAFVRTADGLQPLCALWSVKALAEIVVALTLGEHPAVHQMLKRLEAVEVVFDDVAAFSNLNTLEDHQSAVQLILRAKSP